MKGIGPRVYPFQTRSWKAVSQGFSSKIYYTTITREEDIPCPISGEKGCCHLQDEVGLLTPCTDGRIQGSRAGRDENVLYEIKSFVHLPRGERPPIPAAHTKVVAFATSYYDVYPGEIDPEYKGED